MTSPPELCDRRDGLFIAIVSFCLGMLVLAALCSLMVAVKRHADQANHVTLSHEIAP